MGLHVNESLLKDPLYKKNAQKELKDYMELINSIAEGKNSYSKAQAYVIVLSDSFLVYAEVNYNDGGINTYGFDYSGDFYSNGTVKVVAYTTDVVFTVYRNGEICDVGLKTTSDGNPYVLLEQKGVYRIVIEDFCDTVWERKAEISDERLTLPDNIVGGYNEKAQKGYTNTTLFIDTDVLNSSSVKYVEVRNGERSNVIYDLLRKNPVEYNENSFKSLLGGLGNGRYEIVFKNIYGAQFSVFVNYRSDSTLQISRVTRSSVEEEELSLDGVGENGVWSNYQIVLRGTGLALLQINGKTEDATYFVGSLTSTTKDGDQKFNVYYLDEYGFEFSFVANLFRTDIKISVPSELNVSEIGGIATTKKDVSITFDDANCYYVLNDGEPVSYTSGTELSLDGVYCFTVTDKAGNTASTIVRRDTFVDYAIREVASGKTCINGEVLGTDRATFEPLNGDTAKIVALTLNGKQMPVNDLISGNGKWKLLVEDEAGNRSVFCFYMIYHEINSFDYSTPYGYSIDEVWHTVGDTRENLKSEVTVSDDGDYSRIVFTAAGVYSVVMSNVVGDVLNFGVTIDTEKPNVSLKGVEENSVTLDDVSLTGLKEHDTVFVYRDGKLVDTVSVGSLKDSPVFSESGAYKIVVESRAGNITELNFVKKYVPNVAGSMLIILIISLACIALFIGMVYRTKIKVDK